MMAIAPSDDVELEVRQHPQNALVTPENKEKSEISAAVWTKRVWKRLLMALQRANQSTRRPSCS